LSTSIIFLQPISAIFLWLKSIGFGFITRDRLLLPLHAAWELWIWINAPRPDISAALPTASLSSSSPQTTRARILYPGFLFSHMNSTQNKVQQVARVSVRPNINQFFENTTKLIILRER
jgi:hypothetical protein